MKETRTYNSQVPGPTIKFRCGSEGGQLKIKLINQLPPNSVDASGDNCPVDLNAMEHGLNTTNIHARTSCFTL